MRPTVVLLALFAVFLTASAHAAPPDSLRRVQDPPVVDLAPADDVIVGDVQPIADLAPQPYVPGSYGRNGYLDPQADRKCQCAQYFGGYGPLWENYCYEQRLGRLHKGCRCRGCRESADCGPDCTVGVQPLFNGKRLHRNRCDCCDEPSCHVPRLRRPLRRKAFDTQSSCDCLGPVTESYPMEVSPGKIGAPPGPEAPEIDVDQVAPPPPVNVEVSNMISSRRTWTPRTVGLLPDR
jgi:hypothetical protein